MSSLPSFVKISGGKRRRCSLVAFFLVSALALGMMLPAVSFASSSEQQASELGNQTLSQIPTSFDLHVREWEMLARAAESDKLSKFAIYQSRTLAVKHPEIYLQADAMFDRILTTTRGTKQYLS